MTQILVLDRTAFRFGYQGSTQRLTQLAAAWQTLGFAVSLLRADLPFLTPDGPRVCREFPGVVHALGRMPLNSSAVLTSNRRPLPVPLSRFVRPPEQSWISVDCVIEGLRLQPRDELVIWSVCKGSLENVHLARGLAQALRVPWVVSLHDPPTGLFNGNHLNRERWESLLPLLGSANHICTTSQTLRQLIIEDLRFPAGRISNVPLRAEVAARDAGDGLPILPAAAASGRRPFTLFYAGHLHGESKAGQRSLRPLLEALRVLRTRDPTIHVLVRSVGSGSGHQEARRLARRMGLLDAFVTHGPMTREAVHGLELAAGASLVLQGESQRHQMPSKLFHVLSLDRPVLGLVPNGSEAESVLYSSGRALVAAPADVDAIAKCISRLAMGDFALAGSHPEPGQLPADYQIETLPGQLRQILDIALSEIT